MPTFATRRDSFLNLTEGQPSAFGTSTTLTTSMIGNELHGNVSLALNTILAGTTGTLFVRLVNNDNSAKNDNGTFARLYFQNSAPFADNDSYLASEDTPLNIVTPGILRNDSDPNGDALQAILSAKPQFGTVSLQPDGAFVYAPNANYTGNDSFTYVASDGFLQSSLATVFIAVTAINDAPVAVDDNYSVRFDQPLQISSANGVLRNDYDIDSGTLSAIQWVGSNQGPNNGTVSFQADGSFTYTPNTGFTGNDYFTYRVSDGASFSQPVKVNLRISPTIVSAFADSTLWSNNFAYAALGYPLLGNTRNLPWFNLNQLRVQFSEPITAINLSDIVLSGSPSLAIDYNTGLTLARPDAKTLELTLRSGLVFTTDKVQLTLLDTIRDAQGSLIDGNGDGTPGDPYNLPLTVVRGDVNSSGTVLSSDVTLVTRAQSGIGTYNPLMDVNGSASILSNDVTLVTRNQSGLTTADASLGSLLAPPLVSNPTSSSKFFVPDSGDAAAYRYSSDGSPKRYLPISPVRDVRGSAMSSNGDRLWLVDSTQNVSVFEPVTGIALGSWIANEGVSSEGITVWGNDAWTVSPNTDRVYRFQDGARVLSGSLTASTSFALAPNNTQPTGIVTNGTRLWVSDSLADRIFVYGMDGSALGSWPLDPLNSAATGVTLNPAGGSDLWTVDKGTRKIYAYTGALNWLSSSQAQNATTTYNLNAENADPEDIADPPTIRWIGASGGNWNSASNWSPARVPNIDDDVVIDIPNGDFNIEITGQANARSLASLETIHISSAGVLNAVSTCELTRFTLDDGGALEGSGNVFVTNRFAWNGGTLRGTGNIEIASSATADITGVGVKTLDRPFVNSGRVNALGSLFLSNNASFQNLASGEFRIENDIDISFGNFNRNLVPRPFSNSGTLRKPNGSDESILHLAITNNAAGSVFIESGTIRINAGISNAGSVSIGTSAQLVTFSTQTTPPIATIGYQQTSGSVKLDGGAITAQSGPSNGIRILGGQLLGTGSLVGNVSNAGEFKIGNTIGVLNVIGTYTQTASGLLSLDWQSDQPIIGYDQLQVIGTISLNGNVAINRTSIPIAANEIVFIDNDGIEGIAGTFSNLPNNATVMLDGRNYRVNYAGNGSNSNDLTLTLDAPMLSIRNLRQPESQTDFQFTVSLNRPSTDSVTVNYFTSNDSAVEPSDYRSQNGILVFAPGQTTQTLTVQVVNDSIAESMERFLVTLAQPTFAGIAQATAKGTIIDDDSGPITRDNLGTEFWLAFPTNLGDGAGFAGPKNLYLYISSPYSTTGTVSIPGLNFSQPFTVQPNQTTTVNIPTAADPKGANGVINDLGIHVVSKEEVAVYGLNQIEQTTDAFTGIPLDILDTEYMVLGWKNTVDAFYARTQVNFVATENNTTVRITPSASTLGRQPGVPYTVTLNAGQSYQLQAQGIPLDLSGTLLSSNEPIAVYGGHSCANIPTNVPLCDYVVEQIPPTSTWGTNFYTVPLATRRVGDTVRVIASQDATSISINGTVVRIINQGEVYETLLSQASRIKTNRPVLVAQYANGQGFDNTNADPFMMLIPPSEQFLANYTVSTPAANFAMNFMNLVIPTAAVASLKMDGTTIAANLFTPITNTNHSAAQLFVPVGSHSFTSEVPFGIYSYGFNVYDSYGYPGGMALAEIANVKSLFLIPAMDKSQLGLEHTVTAWATDQNGSRLIGIRIDFEVAGMHAKLGYAFTDGSGLATFRYTGTKLGTDLITASIGDKTQSAKMKWISPSPAIAIESPTELSSHQANSPVLITGHATAAIPAARIVSVSIDGSPVDALDANGNFFARVVPRVGRTTYSFKAVDSYGASATADLSLEGLDSTKKSDFMTTLSELSSSQVTHGLTSWNEKNRVLYSEFDIANLGQYPIKTPVVVGIMNISNPRVVPSDIDGFTEEGIPYYDMSRFVSSKTLAPNQTSDRGLLSFFNPTRSPFTFATTLLAQLNRAPQFTSAPIPSAFSGTSYRYAIQVADADADPISLKLLTCPKGMLLIDGSLQWNPAASDIGTHSISIAASDGQGATTRQAFVLNVTAPTPNRAPIFTSIPVVTVRIGEDYEYNIVATDADGDLVVFAAEGNLPGGMALSPTASTSAVATARLTWTPTAINAGLNLVSLVASDNKPNSRSLQQFQVQVLPELGNRAPEFTSTPILKTLSGQPYLYSTVAIDPDRDLLSYRLTTAPMGMSISTSSGQVAWNPSDANVGFQPIEIEVTDGKGWKVLQSYLLEVLNATPATLSGNVFFDVDGDGTRASTDPPLSNWTIYLDSNQNNRLDLGERSTTSNAAGDYSLGNVTPGAFTLAIVMQAAWAPTLPSSQRYQGVVFANQSIGNLVFGNTTRGSNNHVPEFTSRPNTTAIQGKRYLYTPTASDADGDALTYSLEFGPSGMVIDPASGTLAWFADTSLTTSRVTLKVDDGHGGNDIESFTLNIVPNEPPEFTTTPVIKATVGAAYLYDANAVDLDDAANTLRFKLDSDSTEKGMALDPITGILRWSTPMLGLHPIAISVADPLGAQSVQRYDLAVNTSNVNRPPQILSNPSGQIERGRTFVHTINAIDPDNDSLVYSIVNAPSGMALESPGVLKWNPSLSQLGQNIFTISASDGFLTNSRSITITVSNYPQNDSPRFTTQPPNSTIAGKPFVYDADAFDTEGDTLRFELVASPSGMKINARTGIVDWNPTSFQVGIHPIRLRVSDMRGGSAEQAGTIDVALANRPPVISSFPVTSTPIDKPYNYAVRASDADGDRIRFSLGNRTTAVGIDLDIDSETGILSWTPKSYGTFVIEIVAEDGQGLKSSQLYELAVIASNANQPPRITTSPLFTAEVGLQYTYDLDAFDSDSPGLTYTLLTPSPIPPNASFNPATGVLLWTPTTSQLNQSVPHSIRVSDGELTATQSFLVKVIPANSAPVLKTITNATIVRGDRYLIDASATDADNDSLRFSLDAASLAAGITIDAERGRIGWQTIATNAGAATPLGNRVVTLSATDGRASVSQSFTLTVIADTVTPTLSISATDLAGNQLVSPRLGDEILLFLSLKDNVRVDSRALTFASVTRGGNTTPRNEPLTLDSNHSTRLRITTDLIGLLRFTATATDPSGNVGTATPFEIVVVDPNDIKAPIAQILGGPHFTLSEPTPIHVKLLDEAPLLNWRLELIDDETRRSSTLATGTGNVAGTAIAQLDTTVLRNGAYTLLLTAVDSGANKTIDTASVQIEGALKLGNFNVAFLDLTVPIAGVPITLTRRYDSLDAKVSGDFGYGWSLDIAKTKLEKQIDPERLPDLSGYVPFRDGDRIFVTLPDGTKEGFTFYGKPGTSFLGVILDYVPFFVADVGIKSKLVVDTVTLKKVGDDYLDYASGRLYNPADPTFGGSYELQLRNGSSLIIDARTGDLSSIVDRAGNEVTVSPDGFISKNGRGIVFKRDWANRITTIIDPRGKRMEYAYDGSGDLVSFTNRLSAMTQFSYAENRPHFLSSITDALGRTAAAATYAPDGRFQSLTNASGKTASLAYNIGARTQTVTDANGFISTKTLDARGNVVQTVDQTGAIAKSTFDSKGHVLTQTQVIGLDDAISGETNDLTTTNVYDLDFNMIEQRDVFSNTLRNAHDEHGAVIAAVDAHGNQSLTNYNPNGSIAFTADADGNTTRFQSNNLGNVTQLRDRNNNLLVNATYNAFGEATSMTSGQGRTQHDIYDEIGNNIAGWSLDGTAPNQVQTLRLSRYDDDNKLIASFAGRLPAGRHILANFETAVIPTQFLVSSTQTQFDLAGQDRVSSSDTGLRRETTFDIDGRVIENRTQQRPSGTDGPATWFITRTVYDAVGLPIAVTDAYPEDLPPDSIDATRTEYDPAGRVTAIYRVHGIRIELSGPINSQQAKIVAPGTLIPHTRKTSVFDSSGRNILSTDGYGRETRVRFNAKGQTVETRTQTTTETGQNAWLVSRTVFDSQGRSVLATDQYIDTGSASVSPPVYATNNLYDSRGRSNGTRRVSGAIVSLTGNETTISNSGIEASRTQTEYDSQGRVFREIAADGQVTTTEFDSRGRSIAAVGMHVLATSVGLVARGPNNYVRLRTETIYNALGQKFQSITGIVEYGTVANGQFIKSSLVSDIDRSKQRITESVHDSVGRVIQTILPDGTSTRIEYDTKDRIIAEIGPMGNRKDMTYDRDNRLIQVMLPAVPNPQNNNILTRPTYRYEYNNLGLMSKLIDANSSTTHFAFSSAGQPTGRILPSGQSESMSYDVQRRLSLSISFEGVHKRIIYDDTFAGGGRGVGYDLFANASDYNNFTSNTVGTLAAGVKWERVRMTFDAFGRVKTTTHIYANGALGGGPIFNAFTADIWTNTYDTQGRLIQESSPNGAIGYEYDFLGRKTSVYAYLRDSGGNLLSTPSSVVTYTHDTFGKLKTVTTTVRDGTLVDVSPELGLQPEATTLFYDLLGRLDYMELPNSVVEDYTFDKMDRLDAMRHYQADANNADLTDNLLKDMFDYEYSLDGKRTTSTETFGGTGTGPTPSNPVLTNKYDWTYDNAGRLTGEQLDSSNNTLDQTESYLMDLVGNRVRRTIDKLGTAEDVTDIYSFDASDRLVSEIRFNGLFATGSPSGSAIQSTNYNWTGTQQTSKSVSIPFVSSVVQSMSFALGGQLEKVITTTSDGFGSVTARNQVQYRYDTSGMRFIAIASSAPVQAPDAWSVHSSTEYVIDRANMTGYEQTIIETVKNAAGQPTKRTTTTFGMDEITQTITAIAPGTGQETQVSNVTFGHDGHGSVRALFVAAAALAQAVTYSSYGELLAIHNGSGVRLSNNSSLTNVLYNGESLDSQTGLYHFRARWYSTSSGRFERLDPFIGNPRDPQSYNKYAFTHGDPILHNDPTGKMDGLAGLVIGFSIAGAMIGGGTAFLAGGSPQEIAVAALFGAALGALAAFNPFLAMRVAATLGTTTLSGFILNSRSQQVTPLPAAKKARGIEYADLATNCYSDQPNAAGNGWAYLDELQNERHKGYFGKVFTRRNEIAICYAGTDDIPDIGADVFQGLVGGGAEYDLAIEDAMKIIDDPANLGKEIIFVGHSLGGGLATAAAAVFQRSAVTFNAAGVHPWTVSEHGRGTLDNINQLVDAYRVQGEFLSTIQDSLSFTGLMMPNSQGTAYWLAANPAHSFATRHKMVDSVIPALNAA
ncbi:MAG: Ig-like domain-containing protein [Planctomycetota bacterium]|nr:Ig-like domain-containing protein [Planctomycetota bacterium]